MGYDLEAALKLCDLFNRTGQAGMQDFSRLVHLCHYALETQHLDGDIVEFGCFNGDTAKLLTAITSKRVYLYDSFQGLPDIGEACVPGAMTTTIEKVRLNFAADKLRQPAIHAGWFADIKPASLPAKITLAHLDGDLYASTMQALQLVYDRVVPGGVILVDDYDEPYFEGPKRAVTEFMANRPEPVFILQGPAGTKAFKAAIIRHGRP